jgi:sterol 3beta-glucosyltransferase
MFAHGTRGDVWPVVALAWHMAALDHDVTVAVPDEFREFTESAGVRVAHLPLDIVEWLATPKGQKLLHTGGLSFLRGWQREFSRHADAFDDAYESIAQGAEALLCNEVTLDRTQPMGDRLGIPVAVVYPLPLTPSAEYSAVTLTTGKLRPPVLRHFSHIVQYRVWFHGSAAAMKSFRRRLGLPADNKTAFERQQHPGALALHTVSPSLFPRPSDWPAAAEITGAWQMPKALRDNLGEGLPHDLSEWLEAGDPPVYLGFGSMPVIDPQPLLDATIAATAALGQRVLLNAHWVSSAAAAGLPDHIRLVGTVDHDVLFPRCAAVVHHGGAGSTTASTRAGRPTMICSVLADQPWWGGQVERLGVGVHVPFRKLNHDTLLAGLRTLSDPSIQARARALGAAITAEGDGLPAAARLFDDWLVTAEPTPAGRRRSAARVRRWLAAARTDHTASPSNPQALTGRQQQSSSGLTRSHKS